MTAPHLSQRDLARRLKISPRTLEGWRWRGTGPRFIKAGGRVLYLLAMRRAAWLSQGVVVLRPEDVRDDWTRQALVNEANRLYGRRPGGDR